MNCPHCGAPLVTPEDRFCGNCGARVARIERKVAADWGTILFLAAGAGLLSAVYVAVLDHIGHSLLGPAVWSNYLYKAVVGLGIGLILGGVLIRADDVPLRSLALPWLGVPAFIGVIQSLVRTWLVYGLDVSISSSICIVVSGGILGLVGWRPSKSLVRVLSGVGAVVVGYFLRDCFLTKPLRRAILSYDRFGTAESLFQEIGYLFVMVGFVTFCLLVGDQIGKRLEVQT